MRNEPSALRYFDDEDYVGYVLLNLSLYLCGIQTLAKACEIIHWNREDASELLKRIRSAWQGKN